MARMTEIECIQEGVSYDVYNQWQDVMDALWGVLSKGDKANVRNSGENSIIWRRGKDRWEVMAKMVNNKYVEVSAEKNGKDRLSIVYDNNLPTLVSVVILVVTGKDIR